MQLKCSGHYRRNALKWHVASIISHILVVQFEQNVPKLIKILLFHGLSICSSECEIRSESIPDRWIHSEGEQIAIPKCTILRTSSTLLVGLGIANLDADLINIVGL